MLYPPASVASSWFDAILQQSQKPKWGFSTMLTERVPLLDTSRTDRNLRREDTVPPSRKAHHTNLLARCTPCFFHPREVPTLRLTTGRHCDLHDGELCISYHTSKYHFMCVIF